MNTLYSLRSVCGKKVSYVDAYDMNSNPNGTICCDNCQSILMCREAWMFKYKGVK